MNADARHFVIDGAAAHIFLPAGELGINRAERDEETFAVRLALGYQAGVHSTNILMQNAVETAGPSLSNILFAQARHQVRSFVSDEAAKGPAREVDVGVDDHALYPLRRRAGAKSRRRLPPRISSLAESGMSAPRTLESWEAKLRPPTSLP